MQVRAPLLPAWLRWTAVVGLAGFIFYASLLAAPPETVIDTAKPELLPLDKWRHFLAYAALGYALAYALTDRDRNRLTRAGIVFGVVVLYGVGIEVGQSFLPARYFSLGDAYANALGGVLVAPWYLVESRLDFVSLAAFLAPVRAAVAGGSG